MHDKALEEVKAVITNLEGPVLKHFNPDLPIQLFTDASRTGLGYCLEQTENNDKNAKPRLVMAWSRNLGIAEVNYAVIELELLAIQCTMVGPSTRPAFLIIGQPLKMQTFMILKWVSPKMNECC